MRPTRDYLAAAAIAAVALVLIRRGERFVGYALAAAALAYLASVASKGTGPLTPSAEPA